MENVTGVPEVLVFHRASLKVVQVAMRDRVQGVFAVGYGGKNHGYSGKESSVGTLGTI